MIALLEGREVSVETKKWKDQEGAELKHLWTSVTRSKAVLYEVFSSRGKLLSYVLEDKDGFVGYDSLSKTQFSAFDFLIQSIGFFVSFSRMPIRDSVEVLTANLMVLGKMIDNLVMVRMGSSLDSEYYLGKNGVPGIVIDAAVEMANYHRIRSEGRANTMDHLSALLIQFVLEITGNLLFYPEQNSIPKIAETMVWLSFTRQRYIVESSLGVSDPHSDIPFDIDISMFTGN